jgi:hypothetical protein
MVMEILKMYYLFLVISRRLILCRRFGTLCSNFIGGVSRKNNRNEIYPSNLPAYATYEDGRQCSEMSAHLIHQYRETNLMHFVLNLLRIKGLYMFPALPAHPQEALHKRHLVYRVPKLVDI